MPETHEITPVGFDPLLVTEITRDRSAPLETRFQRIGR